MERKEKVEEIQYDEFEPCECGSGCSNLPAPAPDERPFLEVISNPRPSRPRTIRAAAKIACELACEGFECDAI